MTPRFRLTLAAGLLALAGCSDSFNSGPIRYTEHPALLTLKQEDGTPKKFLQRRIERSLGEVFGDTPHNMIVPKGSGLPEGGLFLADRVVRVGIDRTPGKVALTGTDANGKPTKYVSEGGHALYRKHCLHCHGVSGDGSGPTADFLWPRPRDYRKGVYKFTSTTGQKPTRQDLTRIITHGIGNSSMPAFEALMSEAEIQQVLDYVIFLSARGETEYRLIGEAVVEDEPKDDKAESGINKEKAEEVAVAVFEAWKAADTEVLNPPIPRTPSTPESIKNGKTLFLGMGNPKLECAGCHGPKAHGDGPSFVPYAMFSKVVFGGDPAEQAKRLEEYLEADGERAIEDAEAELEHISSPGERQQKAEAIKKARIEALRTLWVSGSLDDWGNPLRPANINDGPTTQYKGGRRPIDIYWRIAKGINGAKMPAHAQLLKPEQIWDLVNFVLAMPYDPTLMDDAPETVAPATTTTTTAAQ